MGIILIVDLWFFGKGADGFVDLVLWGVWFWGEVVGRGLVCFVGGCLEEVSGRVYFLWVGYFLGFFRGFF